MRRSLVYHIRRKYGLKRYEIPSDPARFVHALKDIFGPSGSKIEKEVVLALSAEFKVRLSPSNGLAEAIRKVRGEAERGAISPNRATGRASVFE